MKIVEQEASVWGKCRLDFGEALTRIELAGRMCYQSIDKIGDDTARPFLERLLNQTPPHLSVTEHSNLVFRSEVLRFPEQELKTVRGLVSSNFIYTNIHKGRVYVYGNFRAWYEMMNQKHCFSFFDLADFHLPWLKKYQRVTNSHDLPRFAKAVTVLFRTGRDTTHEIVRHRLAAFSQESQRYVRYGGDMEFIKPHWYKETCDEASVLWYRAMIFAENRYGQLLANGHKPQDARVVLPNSTATSIVMTAYLTEWDHIYHLRCSKAAYPPIHQLMCEARDKMKKARLL